MAQCTPEEQLAFDIAFGLKKVTIPGFRKALKEEDRFAIAAAIVGHLTVAGNSRSPQSRSNKKRPQGGGVLRPFGQ